MSESDRSPSDIYPSLTYDDAPAAIAWLCRAFGFRERFVVPGPGNRVEHSELSIGTGVVMISSPKPEDRLKKLHEAMLIGELRPARAHGEKKRAPLASAASTRSAARRRTARTPSASSSTNTST